MAIAANLGFPRIGPKRELKKALEQYWAGTISQAQLLSEAKKIRDTNWKTQQQAGIKHIPCNDFSLYDHVLDTSCLVGAVPKRFDWKGQSVDLDTYFAMARGIQKSGQNGSIVHALDMTKWFDTNYHYLVPEFETNQEFSLTSTKPIDEFVEAKNLGIHTRPVLVGPVTYLHLGKIKESNKSPLFLLEQLLPVYAEVLKQLEKAGADWVQIDEPVLILDLDGDQQKSFTTAYRYLKDAAPKLKLLVATYFGELGENRDTALQLPVEALHVDFVRAAQELEPVLAGIPKEKTLSLGLVDGRNIWKTDLQKALAIATTASGKLGKERIMIAPSCSLLHCPVDLDLETSMDPELKGWLAFSKQKLAEVKLLCRALNEGKEKVAKQLDENQAALKNRRTSSRIHNKKVQEVVSKIQPSMLQRKSPYVVRRKLQSEKLMLPLFPTTTIGSFPQTEDLRRERADFKAGRKTREQYEVYLEKEIRHAVSFQEEVGIDVLVHGESERNDMVEYFGEQLDGFAFTKNGWVQSYGSRYVKPPIIFGDVYREKPMTVRWATFANSLTDKPVKGMLTGPVTILQWSFVRNDQPRSLTCQQIALAIRQEVQDLETAGIGIIQIDEPAIREGLPLRRKDWDAYLRWAVEAFRLATSGVKDETQIHTHMCYSEFNDIIEHVGKMDADVISIEATRSDMELLDAFVRYRYPNEIGPGVYDIHSPIIPTALEMETLLRKALEVISPEQLWVNPDCGLKTRNWEQVTASLKEMVKAAHNLRVGYN